MHIILHRILFCNMWPKATGPPNFRHHINSGRYVSSSLECIVRSSRIIRLHALHMLSTPCVCAPVRGSTKWSEWLTVRCVLPVVVALLAAHSWHAAQLWVAMLQHSSEQLLRVSCLRPPSPFLRRPSAPPQLILCCTSSSQLTLIYFDFLSRASYYCWVVDEVLDAYITSCTNPLQWHIQSLKITKTVKNPSFQPNNNTSISHLYFLMGFTNRRFGGPQVHQPQNLY